MEKLMIIDDIKGKNRSLEREVDHLNSKLEDLQWRDIQDNLVFYNIQESQGEDCEPVIVNFLKEEMNIAPAFLYSHLLHLMKDKLLHNGKVVEPPFERNKLPDLNVLPIPYDELLHSQPIMQQGSVFQGHAISIHSIEDAVQAPF